MNHVSPFNVAANRMFNYSMENNYNSNSKDGFKMYGLSPY
jgi:hypothetical protein